MLVVSGLGSSMHRSESPSQDVALKLPIDDATFGVVLEHDRMEAAMAEDHGTSVKNDKQYEDFARRA